MGLHWGAPKLAALVGPELFADVPSTQCDPAIPTAEHDHLRFLNAATGEEMMRTRVSHFHRLRRSALRALLERGVDVRYGKRFSHLTLSADGASPGTVTAHFADGSAATARQLVGADGAHSHVRRALLGPGPVSRPTWIDFAAVLVHASYTAEQARFVRSFHPLYLAGVHPAGKFAFMTCHDASAGDARPEDWRFAFYMSYPCPAEEREKQAKWGPAEVLPFARELARGFSDPWRSAVEWLPDVAEDGDGAGVGADRRAALLAIIPLSSWDPSTPEHAWPGNRGRATLAGDAAHVMTFQRGQALNHALTDATLLLAAAEAARDAGWDAGVRAERTEEYEREVRERAGEEVRLCDVNTEMVHDWEKVKLSPLWSKGLSKAE
jgi:2-polyprenyl-6-methoxyphenol hydroxylase-like FAD-dependent oxidoreductase